MEFLIGVCDDEALWREQLTELIDIYCLTCPDEVRYICYNSAEEYVQSEQKADLLLLDVEMGKMSGIQLKCRIEMLGTGEAMIFISAHQEWMKKAFGKNVYGFLEKPIQKEELFSRLDRIIEERSREVWLKAGNDTYVSSAEIMYIKSVDKYVEIYTKNKKVIGYQSIKECVKQLPLSDFRRVQKSYLINFAHVKKMGTEILMDDDCVIRPRRGTVKELKAAYFNYISEKIRRYL